MIYIPIFLKLMLDEKVKFEILPLAIVEQMFALVVFPYLRVKRLCELDVLGKILT
jgi:hypothetical protein